MTLPREDKDMINTLLTFPPAFPSLTIPILVPAVSLRPSFTIFLSGLTGVTEPSPSSLCPALHHHTTTTSCCFHLNHLPCRLQEPVPATVQLCTQARIVFTSFLSTIIRPSCQGLFNYNLFALLCVALPCYCPAVHPGTDSFHFFPPHH